MISTEAPESRFSAPTANELVALRRAPSGHGAMKTTSDPSPSALGMTMAPTADQIFAVRPAPRLWPAIDELLSLGVDLLPIVADPLAADYIEHVLVFAAGKCEELHAVRSVLATSLAINAVQHAELVRMEAARIQLLAAYRDLRDTAARHSEAE